MSGPILKKCFNCRMKLPEEAANLSQCLKCQKNEQKYGKPGTCQFCKLNAAFHDQKCVWCSHAERKFGEPMTCANCKLNCAFPRRESDKQEGAQILCRLCILQARHTNQKTLAGIPVPPEKPEKSGEGTSSERERQHRREREQQRRKRRHEESTSSGAAGGGGGASALNPSNNNENGNGFPMFGEKDLGENIVKQQKMEDEIRRLKSLIQEKEQIIFEKDKQISNLKADKYNLEKKHRERIQQLAKEKEESIRAMELVRSSKIAKK